MAWLVARVVVVLIALGVGAVLGAHVAGGLTWPVIGGGLGVAVLVALDGLRGRRLLHWLRDAEATGVPADPGLWGELAYRANRALRRRDQAIEQADQRLRDFMSAIEASPNGVLLVDAQERIFWGNSVAALHLSLDIARDLGQPVTNLVRSPAFVQHLQSRAFDQPVVFAAPDGRATLSVLIRAYGDGMLLVMSQDITERERTDAMRRDFVANVSHEMRTPLTVVAGFIETLSDLPLTEVERRRVLALMGQQTDRMQSLLADLLTLAQLEGSARPGADHWMPLATLWNQAQSEATPLSAGRHRLRFDPVGPVEIAGNPSELQSAIGNLLSNAVRYTPEGGSVQLHWARRADGSGVVEVQDSGPGIAREHLPRLTERFYRVDGSRSRETGGTGLGLSIVKHVMHRHGGTLEIDSEPGKGSRFRLVFPAARLRGAETAPPDAVRVSGLATPG